MCFNVIPIVYFFFFYSAYFSGAERLLGTDKNQCGSSTSSSKNRHVFFFLSLYFYRFNFFLRLFIRAGWLRVREFCIYRGLKF